MEKNRIRVRINGVEYKLTSNERPEYILNVAYIVDKKMSEIMAANPKLSSVMAAVLTAVNLADEHLKSKESVDNLRNEIAHYAKLSEEYKEKYTKSENELRVALERLRRYESNSGKGSLYARDNNAYGLRRENISSETNDDFFEYDQDGEF